MIRMIFAQAGVEFEDIRVDGGQSGAQSPWSQLRASEGSSKKLFDIEILYM